VGTTGALTAQRNTRPCKARRENNRPRGAMFFVARPTAGLGVGALFHCLIPSLGVLAAVLRSRSQQKKAPRGHFFFSTRLAGARVSLSFESACRAHAGAVCVHKLLSRVRWRTVSYPGVTCVGNKPGCSTPRLTANQRRLNKMHSSCTVAKSPPDWTGKKLSCLSVSHGTCVEPIVDLLVAFLL